MNKTLREVLEDYKEKNKVIFIVTLLGGNHGDKIIHKGFLALCKEIGIKTKIMSNRHKSIPEDAILYINGSGGIGYPYMHLPFGIFLLQNKFPHNEIILGPTSAMLCKELKYALNNKNMIIFARESTTYNFLKSLDLNIKNLYLDECTSFNYIPINCKSKYNKVLFARSDELVNFPEELENEKFDLIMDPCKLKDFDEWRLVHANSEEIITNRLHSAILGYLMGKKVTLFANYYHKNYSMWKYCLKKRGIKWIGKKWEEKNKLTAKNDLINFLK